MRRVSIGSAMDPANFAWVVGVGLAAALTGVALALGYSATFGRAEDALGRRRTRLRLGLAGGALGLLGALLVRPLRAPPVEPRAEAILNAELRKLLEQPGLREQLIAKSQGAALSELRLRVLTSAEYLSPRDLELWADARLRIARASPQACAKLWTGGDNPAASSALDTFSELELREWAEMSARGVALSLEGKPPPGVAPDALARGFAAVAATLAPDARQTFEADGRQAQLSEPRACRMFLLLFSGARSLPQPLQAEMLRALAQRAR